MKNKRWLLPLICILLTALLCISAAAAFDGYILAFKDADARDAAFAFMKEGGTEMPEEISGKHLLYKTADEALAAELDARGYLAYYEENTLIEYEPPKSLFTVPNMAELLATQYQWSHDFCNTKLAWKLGVTGKGQTLMIIDSGVVDTHPDLLNTVVGGYDYVNEEKVYAPNPSFAVGNMAYYHGTMVSGFAAANYNNIGVAGVACDGSVYMARCISEAGKIPMDKAAYAIMEASGLGASAINMSFGTTSSSRTMDLAVSYAIEDGVILCAAAGNTSGGTEIQYPASCTGAISVAACGSGGTSSGYTSNKYITITAPGVGVISTKPPDKYSSGSGTSYASPYVAGAALLAKSIDKNITPAHFREVLIATANKACLYGAERSNVFGYGIIDVGAMVSALLDEKYDSLYVGPLFRDYEYYRDETWLQDGCDTYTVLNTTGEEKQFLFRAYSTDADGAELDSITKIITLESGKTAEIDVTKLTRNPHKDIGYEITDVPDVIILSPEQRNDTYGITFDVSVYNGTDSTDDCILVTAVYDAEGRMLAAAANDFTMTKGFTPISVMGLPVQAVVDAEYVRCFLLKNGGPVCDDVKTLNTIVKPNEPD